MLRTLAAFLMPGAAGRPLPWGSRKGADGFSLLEVLVATTLMGLILVVLLQVMTANLRAQSTIWGHTQAVLVADMVLEENCQINSLTEGTYQGQHGQYAYQVQISPQYKIPLPFTNRRVLCSVVQVTLFWQEWGQAKSLTLQTVRTGFERKS